MKLYAVHELPWCPPYNGEDRRSLSYSYQKLFQKYPTALYFEMDINYFFILLLNKLYE